jgi:hypothetical protein
VKIYLKEERHCKALILAFILVILFSLFIFNKTSLAAETSGEVNWIDPLGYQKPQFMPITVPDEAICSNKYYVDQQSGSGTICSQDSPCNWSGLSGKPGITGGPAYIYLKGNARLQLTGTLYGSAGNEIVIKPWPGDSASVTMSTTGGGNYTDANIIKGTNIHHLVLDGGADMQFDFIGASSPNNQNAYTLVVSSNYITVARSKIHSGAGYGPSLGVGTGAGTYDHIWIINNEIYDANHAGAPYGVYTGGGTGCASGDTSHSYVYFLNNIIRNICGRGIQIEPRNSANYTFVEGNTFHDTGTNSCGFGQISSAVQPADSCGGSISNTYINNNLMFSLGGGGVGLVGSFTGTQIFNNTIYDYAKATPLSTNSHGIGCYSDGCPAEVENNIIFQANASGINPINRGSGFTTGSNLCESGLDCGDNSRAGTRANTFTSYDSNNINFLRILQTSNTVDYGINNGITSSYFGVIRSGTPDIGADEYISSGEDTTAPSSPGGLTVR